MAIIRMTANDIAKNPRLVRHVAKNLGYDGVVQLAYDLHDLGFDNGTAVYDGFMAAGERFLADHFADAFESAKGADEEEGED